MTPARIRCIVLGCLVAALSAAWGPQAAAQVAVRGDLVYTMAGPPIEDGVVVVRDGRISAVGPASSVAVPEGYRVLRAAIVTPGLIDAHTVVGLSGIYNQSHDQDQIERSTAMQPELRALDAYNTREELVGYLRSFGVTTVHTGHAPGELVSGQTMIVKTVGSTVEDAVLVPSAAVAVTLGPQGHRDGSSSPGTRGKAMAMLRAELIKAQDYLARQDGDDDKKPGRDLGMETLGRVLQGELPLLVTADRAQDIASALRLAREFELRVWLDSAAEAYLMLDEIKEAGVPVIVHPTMYRASGQRENISFETAARLVEAGIPVAMQGGFESYVPKVRVVLFEAALAAAHGLGFAEALALVTSDAAEILGVSDRVGTLEVGKDGDLALFDGDPFEYTTHCVGVVIEGEVVSETRR